MRQRSKTTWRRTIERKRNKAGKSWEVAKAVALGQKVLVRKRDDLMRLLARQEVMMKMKLRGVEILTRRALSTVLHPAQRTAMIRVS